VSEAFREINPGHEVRHDVPAACGAARPVRCENSAAFTRVCDALRRLFEIPLYAASNENGLRKWFENHADHEMRLVLPMIRMFEIKAIVGHEPIAA
jgi:hypothetical protein